MFVRLNIRFTVARFIEATQKYKIVVKMSNSWLFLIFFCLTSCFSAQAQKEKKEVDENDPAYKKVLLATLTLGVRWPGGDLADRFDRNLTVGGAAEWITPKSWLFGVDYQFYFGRFVKEDVIANLRTPDGFVIGNTRSFASIQLRERGFYTGGYIGKIIAFSSDNPRSGIRVAVGMGVLQHKIRVQEDPESFVPAIAGDYKKGYDRLTNGLALRQFLGYQLLTRNKLINFYIGVEFVQGFTQNRREFNFDTREKGTEKRLDLLHGFKVGWSLPFYLGDRGEEVYY